MADKSRKPGTLAKVKGALQILIGTTAGVYLGNVLFAWWDYRQNPGRYMAQSAPWYTQMAVNGLVCAAAVGLLCAVLWAVCRKMNKQV